MQVRSDRPPTIKHLIESTRSPDGNCRIHAIGGCLFSPRLHQLLNGGSNFKKQLLTNSLVPYLQSEYGLHDIFLGIPCRFGGHSVESLWGLSLKDSEGAALHVWAQSVRQNISRAIAMLES